VIFSKFVNAIVSSIEISGKSAMSAFNTFGTRNYQKKKIESGFPDIFIFGVPPFCLRYYFFCSRSHVL
jgi:hypothetical protein